RDVEFVRKSTSGRGPQTSGSGELGFFLKPEDRGLRPRRKVHRLVRVCEKIDLGPRTSDLRVRNSWAFAEARGPMSEAKPKSSQTLSPLIDAPGLELPGVRRAPSSTLHVHCALRRRSGASPAASGPQRR